MKRKRLEMLNLQQRKDDEETALLTPMQQARYLMYLMSLIKEARNVKGGAGGTGRPKPARRGGWTRGHGYAWGNGGANPAAFRDPGFASAAVRPSSQANAINSLANLWILILTVIR